MVSHIYRAKYRGVATNLELELDLGFGVTLRQGFGLAGVSDLGSVAWDFVHTELSEVEEMYVQSIQRKGDYLADVTYREGDRWRNLAIALVENEFATYAKE